MCGVTVTMILWKYFSYRGPLIKDISVIGVPSLRTFQSVGIELFHCIERCPHFTGLEQRGSTVYRGVLI